MYTGPAGLVTGHLTIHPRGFGFLTVTSPDGEVLSAFVPPPDLNPFLAGDTVRARLERTPDGRWTASGLELVERDRDQLFGEVIGRRQRLFLRADREVANTDWPLEPNGLALHPGEVVVARISGNTAIALRKLEPGADLALEQVIARHGLRTELDPEALDELRAVLERPHLLGARRDLRNVPTVTVDAPSTRDIDDAISILPAGPDGALRLLVSIADVAEFIPVGSRLDIMARERGTSVYLAGRVLPMIPEELSADHLSLLPGVDRCCLTVELRVDPEGRVTATDVYESVIRSWARLSYHEVAEYLDHNTLPPALRCVREAMPWFRTAAARIALARTRRGGMEIAREETRIVFDTQTGEPSGIEHVRPTSAHAMIERFMVAANEAIATWLVDRGVPAVYRVHDQPDPRHVAELTAFAHNFGFEPGFGRALSPLALAAFDAQISGAECEPALRSVLLSSLGAARYTVSPGLHFGLAAPLYLHFTSPIRRYADLAVHRTLKAYLSGHRTFVLEDPTIERLAIHLNRRARTAGRAENDRRRILMAHLMTAHVGEVHPARVTRVKPFGLIAQIDATLVDGLLPLDALPDGPYQPDPRETALVGPHRRFEIGTAVTVRIAATDPQLGRIEFALEEGT